MKKIFLFAISAAMLTFMASCEKAVLEEADGGNNGTEVVKSGTKEVIQLKMTRDGGAMLGVMNARELKHTEVIYGVNVYEKKEGAANYSKYAYGLFTDPSKAKIEMYQGRKYKIECLAIQEDNDQLFTTEEKYNLPYTHGAEKTPTKAENIFIKSSAENLDQITNGNTKVVGNILTVNPKLIKYYGVLEDYDPETSEAPNLNLKKVSYGIRFLLATPPEGTIRLDYANGRYAGITAQEQDKDVTIYYSFSDILEACKPGYTLPMEFTLTWTKGNDEKFTAKKTVNLSCNKIINLAVEVEDATPKGIIFNLDNSGMTEENVDWHFQAQ